MGKRSSILSNSERVDEPLVVGETTEYNDYRAFVELQISVHARIRGQVTGELYEWHKAGDVVSVNVLDLSHILERKMGGGCCGAPKQTTHLFKLKE